MVASFEGPMKFDVAQNLAFTKPIAVSINGKALTRPPWLSILLAVIGQLRAKGIEGDRLVEELGGLARADRYEEEGFYFYPDLGISVQGRSASDCWKEVDRLAKKWRIPVSVEFSWRQNPKALYPGKAGIFGPARRSVHGAELTEADMPARAKGARLWLRSEPDRPAVWIIKDGDKRLRPASLPSSGMKLNNDSLNTFPASISRLRTATRARRGFRRRRFEAVPG